MKYFLIGIASFIFLIACKKNGEPFVEICSTKSAYNMADTIKLTNCSKDYTTQRWLLPDGTSSYNQYIYYIPNAPGDYTFKLYVTNQKFVNDFEAVKIITVYP